MGGSINTCFITPGPTCDSAFSAINNCYGMCKVGEQMVECGANFPYCEN
jgi:hypothetical protein